MLSAPVLGVLAAGMQRPAQSAPDMGMEKTHYSLNAMRSCDVLLEPTVAEKREADHGSAGTERVRVRAAGPRTQRTARAAG